MTPKTPQDKVIFEDWPRCPKCKRWLGKVRCYGHETIRVIGYCKKHGRMETEDWSLA